MAKRILYIILGAIVVFGLIFLLWSWLFGGTINNNQNAGTFGEASSTNQTGTSGSGVNGNGETNLNTAGSGNSASTNGTVPLNGSGTTVGSNTGGLNGSGGVGSAGIGSFGSSSAAFGTTGGVDGVDFLNGAGSGGNGSAFNATGINSVGSGVGGSAPGIFVSNSSSGQGTSLIEALAGAAIAGGLTCAAKSAIAAISTGGTIGGATGVGASLSFSGTGAPVSDLGTHVALSYLATQQASKSAQNAIQKPEDVLSCLTNVIAKVAAQQITVSVVNWINSGFNGQPAFVNNFQQFFTNVADAAAGQFIQGSGLAFLCSPFQLQIKIAIAQAYANRSAQSCTLTKVIGNVNNFMNGQFAQGGWPGFVSFTSVPTNNPFGAFAYAQVGLGNAQSAATQNAKNNVSPSGFLSLQNLTGCTNPAYNGIGGTAAAGINIQAAIAGGTAALPPGCKATVTTPGSVISSTLNGTIINQQTQLSLANDADQIISALTTQLATRVLQNGLSSLSAPATEDTASESADNNLIADMQNRITFAQEIGAVYQGSISDIETSQSQLNDLSNCWSTVASSTSSNSAQAATNEQNAQAQLNTLQPQVDTFNNDITNVNNTIATLEQFVTEATEVASASDVQNLSSSYSAAIAAGNFPAQSDVTTAQQNRTTLQGSLSTINTQTASSLQQCQADE